MTTDIKKEIERKIGSERSKWINIWNAGSGDFPGYGRWNTSEEAIRKAKEFLKRNPSAEPKYVMTIPESEWCGD